MISNCIGNCGYEGPPPDSILSMPPPPLPSFLLPKSALLASFVLNNDSNSPSQNPCFATFLCEPNPRPREAVDFVEYNGEGSHDLENTWLFVLISSCIGVIILGGLFAVILLKCKDAFLSSCSLSYHDSNMKQATMTTLGEPSKANSFMVGGILYPCATTNNGDNLQSQLANDSRLLWATLTPHGTTRHYVADNPATLTNGRGAVVGQEGHYEVVDYRTKVQTQTLRDFTKRVPNKSFDNNGFVDYDYEDPTPLMDSYHDDLDSGYQEPQEIMMSLPRVPRPIVSSPCRIDNPNIAPLNYYPNKSTNSLHAVTTMNRKSTVNRRISDASSFGKGPNI